MFRPSRIAVFLALFLLISSTAGAVIFTVTLENGTLFETRNRPVTAEWDEEYVVLLTDQGNRIALRKDEIADVTTDFESAGFGYQADATTLYVGWTPGDLPPEEGEEGEGGQAQAPPDDSPIQYGADTASRYSMDQFLDIPTNGTIDTMNLGPTGGDN